MKTPELIQKYWLELSSKFSAEDEQDEENYYEETQRYEELADRMLAEDAEIESAIRYLLLTGNLPEWVVTC